MDEYLSSPTLSHDNVLWGLERQLYLKVNSNPYYLPVDSIKTKIVEFSRFLNSSGRLSMLQCDEKHEEIIFLLLTLKKTIKSALSELGQSPTIKHSYTCNECNEGIDIDPKCNFWTCLQSHEHFENMYCEFLNGTCNVIPSSSPVSVALEHDTKYEDGSDAITSTEIFYENADSGIDNENCEADHDEITKLSDKETLPKEDVNSFRFNFVLHYDDVIEKKLYPESFMRAVRNVDRIREHTIQRGGPYRAVCLLCSCDLIANRSKISKMVVMDHAMGQRHLRNASNAVNISAVKQYHNAWVNLELNYQAHQVYFKPDISSTMKCVLCNTVISDKNVRLHVETDLHKVKVLDMFAKSNKIFYLTQLQVQVYVTTSIEPATNSNDNKKVKKEGIEKSRGKVDHNKPNIDKNDSDSSPSCEPKDSKHNIIKSVTNELSTNVLDLLPNRFKDHLLFLKNNRNIVTCEICKVNLAKDIETIKKHIMQGHHIEVSKVYPPKYYYFCDICKTNNIRDENAWVRHNTEGPNKHASMAESRKKNVTEYECTKCRLVIYGDDLSLTRHLSIRSNKDRRSKEIKLPDSIKKMFKSTEVIENEGRKLTLEANDTLNYDQLTMECCMKLEATLSDVFQECKVYPFGSRISGLGNKDSDLDVFVDTGKMYTGYRNQDAVAQIQLVRKAAALFARNRDEYQDVVSIPTARTPIVKLFHKNTEIECDLSFRHGLSVENTKFLKFCFELQPITQPLILLLKKWLEYNNLTEHISTYAIALMAIFYMQINHYLLSLKELRELNPEESRIISGWQTIKYTMPMEQLRTYVDPYPCNISRLLKDFFQYYAKFPYPNDVICPLMGCTIKKSQFYEDVCRDKLPKEMKSYIDQLQSEEPEQFRATATICIQDPFDLSHNLTKACQQGTLNKFKSLCDLSLNHLNALK